MTVTVTGAGEMGRGVRLLARDLARVPDAYRAEVRKPIREGGKRWVAKAQANAGWSSRIPAAISVTVRFAGDRAGVYIVSSVRKAPHARVYEGIVADVFRHPVFGNTDVWVPGKARPYILPAVREAYDEMGDLLTDTLRTVLRRHGFDLD